ncbi:uncharacterized protein LOC144167516 [Haemaphysalis longicornis]
MKASTLLAVLALASVAYSAVGASLKPVNKSTHTVVPEQDEETLKKAGRQLETLGLVLQEKYAVTDTSEGLVDLVDALKVLENSEKMLDENSSEYFWKKIRRAVENVAKVVVVNKVAGAVAGVIG